MDQSEHHRTYDRPSGGTTSPTFAKISKKPASVDSGTAANFYTTVLITNMAGSWSANTRRENIIKRTHTSTKLVAMMTKICRLHA